MDDRGKLIAVSVLLVLVVACALFACVGFGVLLAATPAYDVGAEEAARQGAADGAFGTTEGCMGRGYERAEACGDLDFDCQNIAREYILACLRAVPEPSAGSCAGAPERPSLIPDMAFVDSVCLPRGWPSDGLGCSVVAAALETHCAVPSRSTE